jgi:hypothetical protein
VFRLWPRRSHETPVTERELDALAEIAFQYLECRRPLEARYIADGVVALDLRGARGPALVQALAAGDARLARQTYQRAMGSARVSVHGKTG